MGDSITAGHAGFPRGATYPFPLFTTLRRVNAAKRFIMIAQNGWTTTQLYAALMSTPPRLFDDVSVATLCIGGNDLRHLVRRQALSLTGRRPPSLAEIMRTVTETANRLDRIGNLISGHNIPRIIIGTLYNPTPNSELAAQGISLLNDAIRSTAKRYGFEIADLSRVVRGDEPRCIDGYKSGELKDLMTIVRRPIHPNAEGHRRISRAFYQTYDEALHRQSRRRRELSAKPTANKSNVGKRHASRSSRHRRPRSVLSRRSVHSLS